MSYILEALKKAQAERQLGSTPTIHAVPLHAGLAGSGGARRKPIWIAAGAVVLAAGAVALAWRTHGQPEPALEAAPPIAAAPLAAAPVVAVPVVAAPVVAAPAAPVHVARQDRPVVVKQAAPAPAPVAPAPAPAPAPQAAEEILPMQRELPEAIARAVPQVAIGGYIYSSNPADRLLLIDKILRREGEEVAPGLRLEKLLPKAAVMNYKGYRYRVPY